MLSGSRLAASMIGFMALASSTGCSFIFVHRRDVPPEGAPDCTRSRVAPAIDLAFSAGAIALALWAFDSSAQCRPTGCAESMAPAFAVLGLETAAHAGASAIYGFIKTNTCDGLWTDWCASHRCDRYGRPLPPPTSEVVAPAAVLR
jgi:hypothetical protein